MSVRDSGDHLRILVACKSYKAKGKSERKELSLKKGDEVIVTEEDSGSGWLKGKKRFVVDGKTFKDEGWFPKNVVTDPPKEGEPVKKPKKPVKSRLFFWRKKKSPPEPPVVSSTPDVPALAPQRTSSSQALSPPRRSGSTVRRGDDGPRLQDADQSDEHAPNGRDGDEADGDADSDSDKRRLGSSSKRGSWFLRGGRDKDDEAVMLDKEAEREKMRRKKRPSNGELVAHPERAAPSAPEHREKLYASCLADLPEDLRSKIEKAHLEEPDDMLQKHFDVLLNVIRFVTKVHVVRTDADPAEKPRRQEKTDPGATNLSVELLKASELSIHHTDPKKVFTKTEYAGKGGFGRVYYCRSALDKEKVAVKKVPHKTPKERRMNLDEIAILYFCNHPNIVSYRRAYIFEDEASIVMECMEGGSLSQAVKKYDFDESQIAYVAREVLNGISYLHSNQLVHRDLKSANIMMSTKGDVKLIDFGLTVDIDHCRLHMCGSPFWMPPEMIQAKPHGFPADIWSFAVCLIEMADKKPPNRKSRIKALYVSGSQGLAPYVDQQARYTEEFKDFLRLCLVIDPAQRATPKELLKHRFLSKAANRKAMEAALKDVFLTSTFEQSGLFG
eukprot:TRINITY_DN14171_c0_g1_i1.p1 TRINITY_DN14171_c0_g1~~TRINITY_DN14171_c0_g1_i1.p1  ORF type:complete len:613 (-),score=109.05 TRINITY_DN14171_c0_g1_i1:279-2117(-)